ncbi:acyl-protein synthetase [Paraphoma chrysanthemicola]|uniref:Acyl-protein synthetase n=1 Tax=Paraphoma chrysanthemicola TaxID=798071 RepID=A0A8K0RGS5_9PLEO|nr:acyl-protein synthetase [Paraphoma chrysanthemicola]
MLQPLDGIIDTEEVSLQNLLKAAAATNSGGILCYALGKSTAFDKFSYRDLYDLAVQHSEVLRAHSTFEDRLPILLHLDDHWDAIVWFWAVLLANGLPVLSPPFSNVLEHRQQQIRGLSHLFRSPLCITRERQLHLFQESQTLLQLRTIESLTYDGSQPDSDTTPYGSDDSFREAQIPIDDLRYKGGDALAMLMMTSGSTGNAKAVRLSHKQVFAAISGKASVRPLRLDGAFLNWIGLDHVASLVEIHIQALWLGVDQVHVYAADIVASPTLFLDLLSQHRVSRTFAPNFFLGKLASTVSSKSHVQQAEDVWDLSSLKVLASGGEANDVKTCVAASSLLQAYGAPPNVITPGFGMTETCAGAIFNLNCPDYDTGRGLAVASLGKCMNGIEMRIVVDSRLAAPEEPGDLEVRGAVVFNGYYRNAAATANAFPSQDGWFRTGDRACLDSNANLRLIGRKEEVININGIKIVISDIVSTLEQAIGNLVNRFVVFPSRAAHTEQITLCYEPGVDSQNAEDLAAVDALASEACVSLTSAWPLVFSLSPSSISRLPVSTLGKISRAKMAGLFDTGAFDEDLALHKQILGRWKKECDEAEISAPSVATLDEKVLINDFADVLDISCDMIGPGTRVFELGFTSMDLIRLKRRIDSRLGATVPIITLLKNPTVRSLATTIRPPEMTKSSKALSETTVATHDPVVTLKSHGAKTPLWLVHPGVGEVLVFVGLAQHLADDDRPIYALRAKGFEEGQERYSSIAETVEAYVHAILQRQPQGPYAIAGYSYGAMLAFEMSKRLNAVKNGADRPSVRFLGSFNLPPHIKSRMRQLRWSSCLVHLAQFLGLVTEEDVEMLEGDIEYTDAPRANALTQVIRVADLARLEELGLRDVDLARWADVAYGLQSMAVNYEPTGMVGSIDVFHAIPLKQVANSRTEWVSEHLSKWRDFTRTEPRFHEVGGAHYTMMSPEHVVNFAAVLKEAMVARGL